MHCSIPHPSDRADLVLNKHFSLLSMLKSVVLLNIFMETVQHFFGSFDKSKIQKDFCHIINVSLLINASLLNKSCYLFLKAASCRCAASATLMIPLCSRTS